MAKRSNGEGSISKRSDGRYSIKWYDINGERQTTTEKTLMQAKEKLSQHISDVERGIDTSDGKMPLSVWMESWLEGYAKLAGGLRKACCRPLYLCRLLLNDPSSCAAVLW